MSIDALVKAQTTLEWCFQASPDGPYEIGAKLSIDWRMRRAELAVQVALAERMERIAVVLEGAYDPNVEMLRVEAWNYDIRQEVG